MKKNPLVKKIKGKSTYDKNLLFFISRKTLRLKNKINEKILNGFDVWNAYEFSYLNKNGMPENFRVRIIYPAGSVNIVESKSLKLYLYGFSMMKFDNQNDVVKIITDDLKNGLKADYVNVNFFDYKDKIKYNKIPGKLLLEKNIITAPVYELDKDLLEIIKSKRKKTIKHYSNSLKTNCPITGQPDWATIFIKYKSNLIIPPESLLKYLISYRNHNDYHESCCENIYNDLYDKINPDFLTVKCFYTRRGGVDINPVRYYGIKLNDDVDCHYWRQ